MRKTLLIDFDGTLHHYNGEFSPTLGFPIDHSRHAMYILEKTFRLVCFTTRPVEQVEPWLKRYGFPKMMVTNVKVPAFLIVDDRAITFNGIWTQSLLDQIRAFKPHWHLESDTTPDSDDSTNSSEPIPPQT